MAEGGENQGNWIDSKTTVKTANPNYLHAIQTFQGLCARGRVAIAMSRGNSELTDIDKELFLYILKSHEGRNAVTGLKLPEIHAFLGKICSLRAEMPIDSMIRRVLYVFATLDSLPAIFDKYIKPRLTTKYFEKAPFLFEQVFGTTRGGFVYQYETTPFYFHDGKKVRRGDEHYYGVQVYRNLKNGHLGILDIKINDKGQISGDVTEIGMTVSSHEGAECEEFSEDSEDLMGQYLHRRFHPPTFPGRIDNKGESGEEDQPNNAIVAPLFLEAIDAIGQGTDKSGLIRR